ncbi:tripartite motif-containing protein 14 isoform X2 [Catharus ustulatus]|uniref:tripartite motif-containing protein 14 isoform X2 n=1 Tax=Catharus ustulatus TaxID=91951 RepID=UPI00140D1132|nr:tripartite motif-containing protein 14 isoform X2 [Catharus ustulatus]
MAQEERGPRVCGVHAGRPLELFCEDCGSCVCALCPALGAHRGHRAALLPHAVRRSQEVMELHLKNLEERKEQEAGNKRNIQQAVNDVKAHADMIKRQLSEKMTELQLLLREEESLAKNFVDEKTQQALGAHDQHLRSCQEQLEVLDTLTHQIRQIQHDSDPIRLLEKYTEIEKEIKESRHLLEEWHPIPLSFDHLINHYKHFIRVLQSILDKPLEARLKEDARSPTWEYDSIHPRLKLSDDRLEVSCSWRKIFYPCGPQRFDKLWQVLSRDAFLSGSHYWEVDLLHAGAGWWIGAAYPTIGRKGDSEACRLGWNRASWCLKKFDLEYWAFHKGERIPIVIEDDPDCIGIFLDYEAGILSFYNVSNGMAHLHTFRCKFTEPVYPALRLWEGSIRTRKLT